jgi:hypothetical protein
MRAWHDEDEFILQPRLRKEIGAMGWTFNEAKASLTTDDLFDDALGVGAVQLEGDIGVLFYE